MWSDYVPLYWRCAYLDGCSKGTETESPFNDGTNYFRAWWIYQFESDLNKLTENLYTRTAVNIAVNKMDI